jgi:hypothetical protein
MTVDSTVREPMGLAHPDMTPQLAAQLLPNGFLIPISLALQLGSLLIPTQYAATPARTLILLAEQIDAALDRALLAVTATPAEASQNPPASPS